MISVIVNSVLLDTPSKSIFGGKTSTGEYLRIVVAGQPVWPVVGDVFEIDGERNVYTDDAERIWIQVQATHAERVRPSGALVKPFLQSLPGIGATYASRLYERYGGRAIDVILEGERLEEVAKVIAPAHPVTGAKIIARLASALTSSSGTSLLRKSEAEFRHYLEGMGVHNGRAAARLWTLIARPEPGELEKWQQRLVANPYLAAAHMSWWEADHLGQRLLTAAGVDDPLVAPERLVGAADSVWRDLLSEGHTAATTESLFTRLRPRGVNPELAVEEHQSRSYSVIEAGMFRPRGMRLLENQLARGIQAIATRPTEPDTDYESLIRGAEHELGKRLTASQRAAVLAVLSRPFCILQGGAGTGKTWVLQIVEHCWKELGGNAVMAAISGKAALVLTRATRNLAFTCARLIDACERRAKGEAVSEEVPSLSSMTLLILDEASMIDTWTLLRLVTLLPAGARLLLVGDHGQLPPVAPGCVFHDFAAEDRHVVQLTEILRQAAESPIPHAAAAIREGRVPHLPKFETLCPGIFSVSTKDDAAVACLHEAMLAQYGVSELLFVCAQNRTVKRINEYMQEKRHSENPETPELRLGPQATVAVGDRVMCTANLYRHGLRNGQLGVVAAIEGETVSVVWDGEQSPRVIHQEVAPEVTLAWAITCHKSQGSSARAVLVLIGKSRLVTREWLYTAVTRASETVVLVGSPSALAEAVARRTSRVTGFPMSWASCGRARTSLDGKLEKYSPPAMV